MITVDHDNESDWLDTRRQGIGSSDAAKVLGIPWQEGSTPPGQFELWAEKTGKLTHTISESDKNRFRFGHMAEALIAERATEVLPDYFIDDPGDYTIFRHEEEPWLQATVDRLIGLDRSEGDYGLSAVQGPGELKTVEVYGAADWADEPNLYTQVQVQHQMLVGDWGEAWVFAQVGFGSFRHYHVDRSEAFIEIMRNELGAFWRLVEADHMPPLDGTDGTRIALEAMFPNVNHESVILPSSMAVVAIDLAGFKAAEKAAKLGRKECEAEILALIGDAERASIPGHNKDFTWKNQTRTAYTVEEKSFRVLREVKAQEGSD